MLGTTSNDQDVRPSSEALFNKSLIPTVCMGKVSLPSSMDSGR